MNIITFLNRKTLITAAGALALLALILWQAGVFTTGRIAPGRTALAPVAATGAAAVVEQVTLPVTYRAVGTVSSRTMVDISPRVVARVLEMPARSGDRVKKGDLLVKLDDADLSASVNQAAERLKAAQAGVTASGEKVQQVRAAFELASSDAGRTRQLAASGAVSQQALDAAESAYRQARAALAQAEQQQSAAQADADGAAQALRQAQAVLDYTTITSPMDGVLAERLADPGDLASPGNILLRLFDPARLMLEVPVREGLVSRIKIGEQVPFTVDALGRTLYGELRETVPAVDPGSRTFMVRICIGEEPGLMPGMFGVLELPMGTRTAVVVPEDAVVRVGQLEYVRAQLGERTARLLVRTIPAGAGRREVVTGASPGMTIYR
ncbi:efflux RND transporter periplasmic adaptor subunit, partial [bacterium]|nr:efflux RND transporter periplasmic adaptor subunit [bacterium]